MPKTKARETFEAHVESVYGLRPDRWGHYTFSNRFDHKIRLKCQVRSVRFEVSLVGRWTKVNGYYYSQKTLYPGLEVFMARHGKDKIEEN